MTKTQLIIGGIVAAVIVIGYVVVTVTNHDGTALLTLLGGWLGGLAVKPATDRAANG